jgi:phosphatidylserine/phosphatidylglycerophosphate/cardiolipin synthase-like enzyme
VGVSVIRLFLALTLFATPALACEANLVIDGVSFCAPPGYVAPGTSNDVRSSPSISVAFSPHAGATEAVVQVISEAKQSIHLAAYGFTSKPIAQALIAAHQRGVEVEAVLDKSNATARFTEARELAATGIAVRVDYRFAIMHDKFLIMDGVTVETGSFNYTTAAERSNAENVLIVRGETNVAQQYEREGQRLWAESEAWGAKP